MITLENKDWIILNDIIYKINSAEDITNVQKVFLEMLQLLIPYNAATFYLSDSHGNHFLRHPIGVNVTEIDLQEYIERFEEIDYTRWTFFGIRSTAYRETDFYTDSSRAESDYYKKAYMRYDIHYSALLSLVYNGLFLGVVTLYRTKSGADFSDRDLFILDMTKEHLAHRLYRDSFRDEVPPKLLQDERNLLDTVKAFKLTSRESEIVKLLFEGQSNEEICNNLIISSHTLKKHILNIYKKLGIRNRLQLFNLFR